MLRERLSAHPLILEQLPREQSRHQMVVQRLRDGIAQGRPAIGERLPSERELCEQLGVSRTIVREAIRVLAAQGILTVRQGRRAVVTADLSTALRPLHELIDAAARQTFEDVMDARLILEVAAAERAAHKASADDIAAMAAALEALRGAPAYSDHADQAHAAFHRAVAHASHNLFLARMIDSLLENKAALRRPSADTARGVVMDTPLLPLGYVAHLRIFRPIQDRRESAARRAMHEHLSTTVHLYPSLDR